MVHSKTFKQTVNSVLQTIQILNVFFYRNYQN